MVIHKQAHLGVFRTTLFSAAIVPLLLLSCGPGVADFSKALGAGYSFVSTGPAQKYIIRGNEYAVRNLVADFDYDQKFIVALRLVIEEYDCDPGPTLTEVVTEQVEYWIIDKLRKKVVGPLGAEEFRRQRQILGVSTSLSLDQSQARRLIDTAGRLKRRDLVESGACRPFMPR